MVKQGLIIRDRVAPIVYLTLGDMSNDAPGFDPVNLTIPENSTWELKDLKDKCHIYVMPFDFQYIGKENPTMTSMHYDKYS